MLYDTGNSGVSKQQIEELMKEVETMTSLGRHDNVIQLIGCACSTDGERHFDRHQLTNYPT